MIDKLLSQIKSNKKYSSLADSIVRKEIQNYLKSNPNAPINNRQTIKEIRARLHKLYSSFQTKKKNKSDKYLGELQTLLDKQGTVSQVNEITHKLLSFTISTKERLKDYPSIYFNIFQITKKPKIIIDLGAGFNPFSYPLMKMQKLTYYAYDINKKDIESLNKYFKIMKTQRLTGKAEILDITELKKLKQLPNSDIIFMFKLLDLLTPKVSEEIIKSLINKTRFIITSFPTKTITRKPMKFPKRKGFELMLKRNNLNFKKFETENEVFYAFHPLT